MDFEPPGKPTEPFTPQPTKVQPPITITMPQMVTQGTGSTNMPPTEALYPQRRTRGWVRVLLIAVATIVVAGVIGGGIAWLTHRGPSTATTPSCCLATATATATHPPATGAVPVTAVPTTPATAAATSLICAPRYHASTSATPTAPELPPAAGTVFHIPAKSQPFHFQFAASVLSAYTIADEQIQLDGAHPANILNVHLCADQQSSAQLQATVSGGIDSQAWTRQAACTPTTALICWTLIVGGSQESLALLPDAQTPNGLTLQMSDAVIIHHIVPGAHASDSIDPPGNPGAPDDITWISPTSFTFGSDTFWLAPPDGVDGKTLGLTQVTRGCGRSTPKSFVTDATPQNVSQPPARCASASSGRFALIYYTSRDLTTVVFTSLYW